MQRGTGEAWGVGTAYEPYVGRWSRLVARGFLGWLAAPAGGVWVDVGCGTGALSTTVLASAEPRLVVGIDASAGFVGHARAALADDRVVFAVADGGRLPLADGAADVVVSGLVLNFLPDPAAAVGGMVRVVRDGGRVAAYVWDYAEGMAMMRQFWDAAVSLSPEAAAGDEGRRFGICRPDALTAVFTGAGLTGVRTTAVDIPTHFADFDDYWTPFLGGQGPAPAYVASLDGPARTALRDALRARLPIAPDGSITLTARAWAVQGTVSGG